MVWLWANISTGHVAKTENRPVLAKPPSVLSMISPSSPKQLGMVSPELAAGVRVFVPEIADYDVRRKLIHIQAIAGIRRLDQVKATLDYAPITTDVMLRAAEL